MFLALFFADTNIFAASVRPWQKDGDGEVSWVGPSLGRAQGLLPATGSRNRARKYSQPCKGEGLLGTCGLYIEMMGSIKGAIVKPEKPLKRKNMETWGGGDSRWRRKSGRPQGTVQEIRM